MNAPGQEPSFAASAPALGLWVTLASLGVLFASSLLAVVFLRLTTPGWVSASAGPLLPGLAVATGLIGLTSGLLRRGLGAVRANRAGGLQRAASLAGVAAGAFLVTQALNWGHFLHDRTALPPLATFSLVSLTALHAAHVLGGFVPLGIVLAHARRGEYSSSRHEGVVLCVRYWDFLGVVWVVLAATLLLTLTDVLG